MLGGGGLAVAGTALAGGDPGIAGGTLVLHSLDRDRGLACSAGCEKPRYGTLAQALTVAWAINTVLMVAFLGARLLPASIGHG